MIQHDVWTTVPCISQRDHDVLVHEIKILYKETISTFTRDKHVHIKKYPISMIKEHINIGIHNFNFRFPNNY